MEGKKQTQDPCPSPSSSAFKTPRPPLRSLNFQSSPRFFTPRNVTPASSVRGRHSAKTSATAAKSRAARKLRAFEQEQSKSSRKALTDKEKSLKSLAKSLGVWLNFLFENPRSCGCDVSGVSAGGVENFGECKAGVALTGKRESRQARAVEDGGPWRDPKRQRNMSWRGLGKEETWSFPDSMFSRLKTSLLEVCSFDDLKGRMKNYLTLASCKEIFTAMTQVAKNIDEGRLKMKAHCPMVTDVGMKQKALKTLMCYNPIWLRIGLYIILGGDSLLQNEDANSEQEVDFLRMLIEKQFFTHAGLAKTYAYNKLVEGLYRPGYYDELGKVILKRFLLLVLVLDRAKCQSSLPCKYGIDGLDGGSPMLFSLESHVKSSNQLINEFLSSDVMHGEGNLLAHLVIMGFKATYQQNPLVEYQFKVVDIFEDLQDGVRLCRAVQLLQHDPSILVKMLVPSDTRKKCLNNCGVVLQYVQQASVPMTDEDGTVIMAEDVVNGDKELIISLLWNIFVHLQLPLLINKALMVEEIQKIQGFEGKYTNSHTHLDMLLCWIQAICKSYDLKVDAFSSLADGKAMWCLLDFYFRKELHCSCSFKASDEAEVSIVSAIDYTDAVHNFILSQKLPSLLGKFPEVLQVSDILESNGVCNGRSVVILLAFLSFQLLVRRNTEHLNFHKLLGFICQSPERRRLSKDQWFMNPAADMKQERIHTSEDAAKNFNTIMSWWKDMALRNSKSDMEQVPETKQELFTCKGGCSSERGFSANGQDIMKSKNSVQPIQTATRMWINELHQEGSKEIQKICNSHLSNACIVIQKCFRGSIARSMFAKMICQAKAAVIIQRAWIIYRGQMLSHQTRHSAALKIQRHWHGWLIRKAFINKKKSAALIQSAFRSMKCSRDFKHYRCEVKSAIIIQACVRGWIARRDYNRCKYLIVIIQSHCRGCIKRKELSLQKEAAVRIQTAARWMIHHNTFLSKKNAATEIQRLVRGEITRKRLLGSSRYCRTSSTTFKVSELRIFLRSVTKLQRLWRAVLLNRQRERSATVIQSLIRGWIARKQASRKRYGIIVIQSYTKAYLVRKKLKGELLDLRLRVQKSASNIDDSMRIINRLLAALSELLSMKSLSGILHTCETLDMATRHSQRCCEELVAAGAVEILVRQMQSLSRSIPDQEVLKLALSTLRNLTRYPHLIQILISTPDCIDTIFLEFLRNKEEGYFIAAELLKKLFLYHNAIEAVHNLPALVKRLHIHVEELSRKAKNEKRTTQAAAMREKVDRRLREAVEILELIKSSSSN